MRSISSRCSSAKGGATAACETDAATNADLAAVLERLLQRVDAIGDVMVERYRAEIVVAGDVDVVVPGHRSICGADQVHARIDQDRAYVHALRDADVLSDPRVGPSATYGKDWLPGVHERQLQHLARRRERDGTPG